MTPSLIRELSDSDLIQGLKSSVSDERKQTALVLEFLRETDRRRLFAEFGCSSLWEFCTRELGYSEGSASRRIASMRLLRELPELKEDLLDGKQTLSSLAQAQRFFKVEEKHQSVKLTPAEKCKVLERLEGKSSRECEKELLRLSSSPLEIARPERTRLVDETHTELKLVLEERTLTKLKRIQALRSHAQPHPSYAELLDYMADEVLKRIDPAEKAKRAETRKTHSAPPPTPAAGLTPTPAAVGPTPTSAVARARLRRRR
jgi:hypothetical protein